MNRTPEQKFILLFEALKRSLLVIHRLHQRLNDTLLELEPLIKAGADVAERAADPMIDSISLVDFLHRFGALADALPLVTKRSTEMKRLQGALVEVEIARNYLQHIRGDLSTNAGVTYPVLGSVLWSRSGSSYALQFSQAIEATLLTRHHFSKLGFPTRLQFRCKETVVDFDKAIEVANETYDWIKSQMTSNEPLFFDLKWGNTLVFKVAPSEPPQ
jgi:hypothetical protein